MRESLTLDESGVSTSPLARLLLSKSALYLGVTLFLLIIFGLKDGLILTNGRYPHLATVVNSPVLSWEEAVVYLPFANRFSLQTPLPAAPAADPTFSQLTNFPPLTLILQGVLFQWIFRGRADAYFLALHTLLPTAAFWVLFLIYRRYVAQSWSLLVAFWGVTFFRNFSSLGFWVDWLAGRTSFVAGGSLSPMELTRLPTPAISFLLFALTFYFTTRTHRLSERRLWLYTLLWALHIYVYLFNFMAGILFWFGYLLFVRYMADRGLAWRKIGRTLLTNAVVVLLVSLPVLLRQTLLATPLDRQIFQRMGLIVANAGPLTSEWGVLLAYVLPLAVVLLVAWASYADYYEIVYRFAPVFLMIFVEIIILNLHLILGQFFQPHLFSVRIGNFFSRYLYFIPIIYFISQPRKARIHHSGRLMQTISPLYRRGVAWLLRGRHLIALLGIALIALVTIASSLRYVHNHNAAVAPAMQQTAARFDALTAAHPQPALLISDDIGVNLLLPARSPHQTLLVSSFNNYLPEAEILERLLLYAHIFNWSEARFLAFMLPSPQYDTFYTDNSFIVSPQILEEGFGYWLLNHRRQMNAAELAEYKRMLTDRFNNFDVKTAAQHHQVAAVQSRQPINPALEIVSTISSDDSVIYQLAISN